MHVGRRYSRVWGARMTDTTQLTNVIAAWNREKLIQCCRNAGIDPAGRDSHELAEELVRAIDESIERTRWIQ